MLSHDQNYTDQLRLRKREHFCKGQFKSNFVQKRKFKFISISKKLKKWNKLHVIFRFLDIIV